MNRTKMPLILMLVAGAATCIITLVGNYSILDTLTVLFIVLVIFYFLGSVLKWTLDYFDNENEQKRMEEEQQENEESEEVEGAQGQGEE